MIFKGGDNIFLDGGRLLMDLHPVAKNIIEVIQTDASLNLSDNEALYVNYIVSNLIEQGIWDKIKALYGFVGGTAATHKWNWRDMRDLDDAFRLSFFNSPTHSDSGVKFLRSNSSYADTYLVPDGLLTPNTAMAVGIFDELTRHNDDIEIGALVAGSSLSIATRRSDDRSIAQFRTTSGSPFSAIKTGQTNGIGFHLVTKISNANTIYFQNGQEIARSTSNATGDLSNIGAIKLGANTASNSNIASNFSSKGINIAIIFQTFLTELEAIQMSHIITTAQGILGRA